MGFRGPRPGTRLPAHPGPSRALGPAWAHPAPFQHTLLTDCPDSDSALPQATIQLSSIGISRHLRLRSAHRADGCPRLGRFARAISLSWPLCSSRQARFRPQLAHRRSQHSSTRNHGACNGPSVCHSNANSQTVLAKDPAQDLPELDQASLRGGPDKHVDRGPHQAPRPGARPGARQAHRPGALQPSRRIKLSPNRS